MQSKVTLTFRKTELNSILWNNFQSKIIELVEEKKGGRGPLGPSPKSAYATRSSFKTFILALNKWNDRFGFWDLLKASWFEKNTIPCVLSTKSLLAVV